MVVPRCYQDISMRQTGNQMEVALQKRISFGRDPAALVCKNCGQFIVTEISRHNGVCSFFTVLVSLFLCTPCAWLPLIVPTCKDTLHTCPNCGAIIGIHRYFK
ncbi:hypothetical protein NPIL_607731 [Nephila pilipes]|uniref:LITAF domain-containing protein n=1 Tax=Nephila pilipes TaxID=299642 RepID=A0A8X6U5Q5_NEPPI|nr:hypothetical protein NPIL_607731 [Nephila pilipes]